MARAYLSIYPSLATQPNPPASTRSKHHLLGIVTLGVSVYVHVYARLLTSLPVTI